MSDPRRIASKNIPELKHITAVLKKPKTSHRPFSDRLKNATLHKDANGNFWLRGYEFKGTDRYKTAASHFNHTFSTYIKKLTKIPNVDYRAAGTNDEAVLLLPFLKNDPAAHTCFLGQLNAGRNANNTSTPVSSPDDSDGSLTNAPSRSFDVLTENEQTGFNAKPTSDFSPGSASSSPAVSEETKDSQLTKRQMLTSCSKKRRMLDTIRKKVRTINNHLDNLIVECLSDGISIDCDGDKSLEEKIVMIGSIINTKIASVKSCSKTQVDTDNKPKSGPPFPDRLKKAILVRDDDGDCWLKDYEAVEDRGKSTATQFNRSFRHYRKKIIEKPYVRYLAEPTEDDTIISLPFLKADPAAYEYFLTLLGGEKVTSIQSFLKEHVGNKFFTDLLSNSENQIAIESTTVPDNNSNFSVSTGSALRPVNISSTLFHRKRLRTSGEKDDNSISKEPKFV